MMDAADVASTTFVQQQQRQQHFNRYSAPIDPNECFHAFHFDRSVDRSFRGLELSRLTADFYSKLFRCIRGRPYNEMMIYYSNNYDNIDDVGDYYSSSNNDVKVDGIEIVSASYGINCNPALVGNRNTYFSSLCNGQRTCSLAFYYDRSGGDPAENCSKNLKISYRCNGSMDRGPVYSQEYTAEAGLGRSVLISCDDIYASLDISIEGIGDGNDATVPDVGKIKSTLTSDDVSIDRYLNLEHRQYLRSLIPMYRQEQKGLVSPDTGEMVIPSLKETIPPSHPIGKSNFLLATLVHLEHFTDQITYLLELKKLPAHFKKVVSNTKYVVIPFIAKEIGRNNSDSNIDCVYESVEVQSNCCHDLRIRPFVLHDWMVDLMHGTFNRMIYYPPDTSIDYARQALQQQNLHKGGDNHVSGNQKQYLNSQLDYNLMEERYLAGDVLQVDNILSPKCLNDLYNLALEATFFYDAKTTYMGAYLGEGLGENKVFMALVDEFRIRFPLVIRDLPLGHAWFYKYDSSEAKFGGRGTHADQAEVNINIWLTPDDANNDPLSGGLVVFDKGPQEHQVASETFQAWNLYDGSNGKNSLSEWLIANNSSNVTVPYLCNRAVMFDSSRLHHTDRYNFKKGYKNRRINLTLLFGKMKGGLDPDRKITNNLAVFA